MKRIKYIGMSTAHGKTLVNIHRGEKHPRDIRTHYRPAGDCWAHKIAALLSAGQHKTVSLYTDGWIVEL